MIKNKYPGTKENYKEKKKKKKNLETKLEKNHISKEEMQ